MRETLSWYGFFLLGTQERGLILHMFYKCFGLTAHHRYSRFYSRISQRLVFFSLEFELDLFFD